LNGAGAPHWNSAFRGTVLGLALDQPPEALIRAVIEGICFELRSITESLERLGPLLTEIRVWGGPSRSGWWSQLLADVLQLPLRQTLSADSGLVGVAVLTASRIGLHPDLRSAIDSMVRVGPSREPNPALGPVYEDCYRRYLEATRVLLRSELYDRWSRQAPASSKPSQGP
jgi:xylulokinase